MASKPTTETVSVGTTEGVTEGYFSLEAEAQSFEPVEGGSVSEFVDFYTASGTIKDQMLEDGYVGHTTLNVGEPLDASDWTYVYTTFGYKLRRPEMYSNCADRNSSLGANNCIAWALGVRGEVQCEESETDFINTFRAYGYEVCDKAQGIIDGYMKNGIMEHASRYESGDTWTSLLGPSKKLIGHTRDGISDSRNDYGEIVVSLKKITGWSSSSTGTLSTTATSSIPSSTSLMSSSSTSTMSTTRVTTTFSAPSSASIMGSSSISSSTVVPAASTSTGQKARETSSTS